MRKRQNEMTSSSKNGEYLILGRNSDFREKFGILELEMLHPDQGWAMPGFGQLYYSNIIMEETITILYYTIPKPIIQRICSCMHVFLMEQNLTKI